MDLCDLDDDESFFSSFSETEMPAKNNKLSKYYREKAAEHVELKNWFDAIEFYNQALCFAESGSIEWAVILTDRSSCFFHLKMYNECLVDVKLAKTKAGADIFMAKLNRLSAMCGQKKHQYAKNEQLVYQFKPTLSFDVNKQIPFAANVIGIEEKKKKTTTTTAKERLFHATRSIEVGKTILIEDGFVATAIERYKRCCICMKSATNLVPCDNCTNSLFCHGTCKRKANDLHRVECNNTLTSSKDDENNSDLVIRSILKAFQIIPTANGLLCFVEKVLFDKQYDALASDFGRTAQSKYAIFLQNGQKMLHMADTDGMQLFDFNFMSDFFCNDFFCINFFQ